jgi:hypothetical protein
MHTKTAVRTISLYDLIANNMFIIFATLHHIIILVFNHYAIENLNILKLDDNFDLYITYFDYIQENLHFCQQITLFTLFCLLYFEGYNKNNKNKNNTRNITDTNDRLFRFVIMTLSYIIKMIYTSIQVLYVNPQVKQNINKIQPNTFGLYYMMIISSYAMRITVFVAIIAFIICLLCGKLILICFERIEEWAKTFTIVYTEKTLTNETEEV